MELNYILADPSGNRTILVTTPLEESLHASVASRLMQLEPSAEQTGFLSADGLHLRMAGGEFCGNATMSAAAVYALAHRLSHCEVSLQVSGTEHPVAAEVTLQKDCWVGTVHMPLPLSIEDVCYHGFSFGLVRFGGISHLISFRPLERDTAETLVQELCTQRQESALGIMMYDGDRSSLTPLVYVPELKTLFWEGSCASGTAALGAYLADRHGYFCADLKEPSGILRIESDFRSSSRFLALQGRVTICREGHLSVASQKPAVFRLPV